MQDHVLTGELQMLSLGVMMMETLSHSSVAEWTIVLIPVAVCTQEMEARFPTQ